MGKVTQGFQRHCPFALLELAIETVALRCPFRWTGGLEVIPLFRLRCEELAV